MNEIRICWDEIQLREVIDLENDERYEDIYFDGDRKEVVIINPSPKVVEALRRCCRGKVIQS